MTRFSDLRSRDVVSLADGRRVGMITDLVIDIESGRIISLVIPGPAPVLGVFGRAAEFMIPWEKIRKIGEDVILVELPP